MNYRVSVVLSSPDLYLPELDASLCRAYAVDAANKVKSNFSFEPGLHGVIVHFERNYESDAKALLDMHAATGLALKSCAMRLLADELVEFKIDMLSWIIDPLRLNQGDVTGYLGNRLAMDFDDLFYAVTQLNLVTEDRDNEAIYVRVLVLNLGISVVRERNHWKSFFGSYGHDTVYLERDTYDEAVLALVLDRHLDPAEYEAQ